MENKFSNSGPHKKLQINELIEPSVQHALDWGKNGLQTEQLFLPPIRSFSSVSQQETQKTLKTVELKDLKQDTVIQPRLHLLESQMKKQKDASLKRKRFDLHFDIKQYQPPSRKEKYEDDSIPKNYGPWTQEEDAVSAILIYFLDVREGNGCFRYPMDSNCQRICQNPKSFFHRSTRKMFVSK